MRALPDSANVFNDVIRYAEKNKPMAREPAPAANRPDPRPDGRILWRLGGWGVAAALALAAAAIASQSMNGNRRLDMAFAQADLPARPVATLTIPPPENQAEIKRLTAQVHQLAEDRARLSERVAGLEQQLGDLTGSIKLLAAAGPPEKTPPTPKPPATRAAADQLPVKPVVTTAITRPPAKPPAQLAKIASVESAARPPPEAGTPALDKIPLPSTHLAEIESAKSAAGKIESVESKQAKPSFAIALAGASSIAVARLQWAAVKANFGPLLGKLEPRAVNEGNGKTKRYRLLIGPLPSSAAAAKLCAPIIAAHALCQPARFTGEPL
jgi:hypothetical protein